MKITIAVLAVSLFSISVHAQEREPSHTVSICGKVGVLPDTEICELMGLYCEPEKRANRMLITSASIFAIAGNAADLITTKQVLDAGGHESNTTINGSSFPHIAATKAITVGLTVVAMKVLAAHGHPKIAAVLGFGSGFLGFGAAYHNAGQVE